MDFIPFPKISRLNKPMIITEKIDGTNASITIIGPEDDRRHQLEHDIYRYEAGVTSPPPITTVTVDNHFFLVGSRKRWITPDDDNFGFARWVYDHSEELVGLGPGTHRGEWYGQGIQRGYGLGHKRFALFNTHKWDGPRAETGLPECCSVVPVLSKSTGFDSDDIFWAYESLWFDGSRVAAPGWTGKAEGVMVYLTGPGIYLKHPFDPRPKGKS